MRFDFVEHSAVRSLRHLGFFVRKSKKTKVATGTAASEADAAGVAEPKTPKKRGRKPKGGQLVDIKSATDVRNKELARQSVGVIIRPCHLTINVCM